jgi:hypothetical protein
MNPSICGKDAAILLNLIESSEERGAAVKRANDRRFTWPQIRYWLFVAALVVVGVVGSIWSDLIPWEWMRPIAKELCPGIFTAGILAGLVEPFFRKEFARDAFLASFRYVLSEEFKEEVAKILAYNFISKDHIWTVKVDKTDDNNAVFVTTTIERNITNRTSSEHARRGLYTIPEYNYNNGKAEIKELVIETKQRKSKCFNVTTHNGDIVVTTEELKLSPGETAKISGKAIQYRRMNDAVYETFIDPLVNPSIEVIIDNNVFYHRIEFGTKGDVEPSRYANKYKLTGVYFPGQYMLVRWWPKKGLELPGSAVADPAPSRSAPEAQPPEPHPTAHQSTTRDQ